MNKERLLRFEEHLMTDNVLKYIPGPWEVSWSHDATGYPVFSIHSLSGEQKRDKSVLDATVRLMALAPELVEALDDLLNLDERCGWFSKEGDRALAVLRKITEN